MMEALLMQIQVEMQVMWWAIIFLSLASLAAVVISIYVWVQLEGMARSTHQVQYTNLPTPEFEELTEEMKKNLTKSGYDNII